MENGLHDISSFEEKEEHSNWKKNHSPEEDPEPRAIIREAK